MSEAILIAVGGSIANGLMTWGVVLTTLRWHKGLLDDHAERIKKLEARPCIHS
jgi:hypothetical protein